MGIRVINPKDVQVLHDLALNGAQDTGGDATAPTGWFAILPFRGGWYVVTEGEWGDVSAFGYRSEFEASGHFDDLRDTYVRWLNGEEEKGNDGKGQGG